MGMNDSFTVQNHPKGKGIQVLLGELEIQDAIASYSIFHSGTDMPTITLTLDTMATNNHYDDSKLELQITHEQKELLKRFGWTAPEESV